MQPDDDSFPKRIFNGTNSSLNKHILRDYYVSFSLGERLIYIYDFYKNTKMKMATIITVVSHVDYWHRFEDRSIDRDPRLKRELLVHPPSPSRSCFALCILLPPPSPSPRSIPLLFSCHAAASATSLLSIVAEVGHGLICRTLNLVVA